MVRAWRVTELFEKAEKLNELLDLMDARDKEMEPLLEDENVTEEQADEWERFDKEEKALCDELCTINRELEEIRERAQLEAREATSTPTSPTKESQKTPTSSAPLLSTLLRSPSSTSSTPAGGKPDVKIEEESDKGPDSATKDTTGITVKVEDGQDGDNVEAEREKEGAVKDEDPDTEITFTTKDEERAETPEPATTTKRSARSSEATKASSKAEKSLPPPPAPTPKAGRSSGGTSKRSLSERSDGDGSEDASTKPMTRRLRGKRGDAVAAASGDAGDGESPAYENKRVSRLRGAAAAAVPSSPTVAAGDLETASTGSGSGRDRRGSGATSRSSSPPTESEERAGDVDSETERNSGGGSKPRRRSGRVGAAAVAAAAAAAAQAQHQQHPEDSTPSSPGSSSAAGGGDASGGGAASATANEGDGSASGGMSDSAMRKALLLLHSDMDEHRFANFFRGASFKAAGEGIVKIQEDLSGIRKRIENGTLRNITEYSRAMHVMFFNVVCSHPEGSEVIKRVYTRDRSIFHLTFLIRPTIRRGSCGATPPKRSSPSRPTRGAPARNRASLNSPLSARRPRRRPARPLRPSRRAEAAAGVQEGGRAAAATTILRTSGAREEVAAAETTTGRRGRESNEHTKTPQLFNVKQDLRTLSYKNVDSWSIYT